MSVTAANGAPNGNARPPKTMNTSPGRVQLARILGVDVESLDGDAATQAAAASPGVIASELFEEAAASDDVVDMESARSYLELRLAYFRDIFDGATAEAIRAGFEERLAAWG